MRICVSVSLDIARFGRREGGREVGREGGCKFVYILIDRERGRWKAILYAMGGCA